MGIFFLEFAQHISFCGLVCEPGVSYVGSQAIRTALVQNIESARECIYFDSNTVAIFQVARRN